MSFLNHLRKKLPIPQAYLEANELNVQQHLAGLLRQQAIDHLRTGKTRIAKGFRGEYERANQETYTRFLNRQMQNGAWATYIEAQALAELFQCNLMITSVTNGKKEAPWPAHTVEQNAPTIHLYNSNNTHWYVNLHTQGDGNCLYNAFAQALQTIVKPELDRQHALAFNSVFKPSNKKACEDVLNYQHSIASSVVTYQKKPTEQQRADEAEQARLKKLSNAELKQIQDDHDFAMELAFEEMKSECQQSEPRIAR